MAAEGMAMAVMTLPTILVKSIPKPKTEMAAEAFRDGHAMVAASAAAAAAAAAEAEAETASEAKLDAARAVLAFVRTGELSNAHTATGPGTADGACGTATSAEALSATAGMGVGVGMAVAWESHASLLEEVLRCWTR
jgi:hypothetical protein